METSKEAAWQRGQHYKESAGQRWYQPSSPPDVSLVTNSVIHVVLRSLRLKTVSDTCLCNCHCDVATRSLVSLIAALFLTVSYLMVSYITVRYFSVTYLPFTCSNFSIHVQRTRSVMLEIAEVVLQCDRVLYFCIPSLSCQKSRHCLFPMQVFL